SEFVKEKDLEAQEGELTAPVTTQIELYSKGDTMEDSEADEVVETIKTPKGEEEIHMEDKEPSQTKETDTTDLERFKETLKELDSRSPEEEQHLKDYMFLTRECSEILTMEPQQKQDYLKSLPISCSIGETNIEDVPIKVNDLVIPIDFVVLEEEIPLIFGKPFLATIHAMINEQQKEIVLRMDNKEEAHDEGEDQEKQWVEIETDQRDTTKEMLSVCDEDFYRGAEPQPMKIQ
ncbi:hypothetical protein A2U01_0029079, partial [Trifolium medium]|nr:hypothetical protein [Trifolium medium]